MNTNRKRALSDSKYNERRAECEKGFYSLLEYKDIRSLCDLRTEDFEILKDYIKDDVIKKRVKHVVEENERVKNAYDALSKGNINEFGRLLIQSHDSLKNLYEVTGGELDAIVEEALKFKECIGARMTGAGFGGCAIALVEKTAVNLFINKVSDNYFRRIGYKPSFYITGIGEGTCEEKK